MNPFERAIRAVDHTQRRFTPTAFVFGVVKKQGDDNGGVLTSNLAFAAFRSLFPLLLILVTILGLLASVNEQFKTDVLSEEPLGLKWYYDSATPGAARVEWDQS